MTREEQIIEAGAYHSCGRRPPKTCGHNMHELAYITRNLSFEEGAKWADEHPKPGMVNKQEFMERACKILKSTIVDDVFANRGSVIKYMTVNEFIEYFCKTMEK